LSPKLQAAEIQTTDDINKIVPNGKVVLFQFFDQLFKTKVEVFFD
jgi:hypothetical protein